MKKIVLFLISLLTFGFYSSQCDYTINMQDSYGDGWNGASISIDVNGINSSTVTLNNGSSWHQSALYLSKDKFKSNCEHHFLTYLAT